MAKRDTKPTAAALTPPTPAGADAQLLYDELFDVITRARSIVIACRHTVEKEVAPAMWTTEGFLDTAIEQLQGNAELFGYGKQGPKEASRG